MLEAAMFGGTIPENPAGDGNLLGNGGYGRPIQLPSPSVIAQRLLWEQQVGTENFVLLPFLRLKWVFVWII